MSSKNLSHKVMAGMKKSKSDFEVFALSDPDSPCIVEERISTGCLVLDYVMGGGLPVGRLTEFFGDPSSGKSLIAAGIIAQAQADKSEETIIGYVDTESAVSMDMMRVLGVDVDNIIYSSPDTVEQVFSFFEELVENKQKVAPDARVLLVWDSVASTSVEQEMDNPYGKATMGRHANLISQSLRKFTRVISKERVAMLFLNQTREKIGVMFGDNTATFGGKAIPFHSSVRVQLDLTGKIKITSPKNKKKVTVKGMFTKAVCVKNKTAMPYRYGSLHIYFGTGIDDYKTTFSFLKENDLMTVSGGRYRLNLGEEELVFTKDEWEQVYSEFYEDIKTLIFELDKHEAEVNDEETIE